MKKTKVAVLFTALMAVLGLSSCLGDPDPYTTLPYPSIMKVSGSVGFYEFEDASGLVVIPKNQEALSTIFTNAEFAFVNFKYDTRELTNGTKRLQAEIINFVPINDIMEDYVKEESNGHTSTISQSPVFFDKNNMFISLEYYYEKFEEYDKLKEELNKHSFGLYLAKQEEDEDVTDDTLVLYFSHRVSDPENNNKRTTRGTETYHFDLSNVLNGNMPEKIIIKYKASTSSSNMNEKYSDIVIEYRKIFSNNI